MLRKLVFALAPILYMGSVPAVAAGDPISKAVGDTKVVTLDLAASYLIVQTNSDSSIVSFGLAFIRRPEAPDMQDYSRRRKETLDRARAKWELRYAQWTADLAAWERLSDTAHKTAKRPVEPVEPTDQNLAFPALDMENMLPIGPFNRFSKANGHSTFIHRVQPGRYAFYGSLTFGELVGGICMCMGTFEFDIAPGQIVYAGMMADSWLDARAKAKAEGKPVPKTGFDLPPDVSSLTWTVPTEGAIDDPRLAAYRIVPAQLRAAGRIPNYYGVPIDRITSISGVLAYDGDKVIDARTGKPVH